MGFWAASILARSLPAAAREQAERQEPAAQSGRPRVFDGLRDAA